MEIESSNRKSPGVVSGSYAVKYLAWIVGTLLFLNALYYVVRVANPVIRSDAWYFLDVFLRRVLDGTVGFSDFFVKRHGADHAQPVGKLLLLVQLRFFDLDFSIESVVGIFSAAICAALFYRIITSSVQRTDKVQYIVWAAICAVLFSLNSPGVWTWPLVAMQNFTFISALLFVWAVWYAWQKQGIALLAAATLTMGVINDDGAIIISIVVVASMLFAIACNTVPRDRRAWLVMGVVFLCMIIVRLCYNWAPLEGGVPMQPFSKYLVALHAQLNKGGGFSWISIPLGLSMVPRVPIYGLALSSWDHIVASIVAILLVAHGCFWWAAMRTRHNLATFTAVCLMLLSYAWLAGILLYRVSYYGTTYLYQDRYVFFYQFNLIALLLFFAGSAERQSKKSGSGMLGRWVLPCGCLVLILVQVPLSIQAWKSRRYLVAYYRQMAVQLENLAANPSDVKGCLPELAVCSQPLNKREELVQLLKSNRLNVFSTRVQRWHSFLPRWDAGRVEASSQVQPAR